MDSYSQTRPSSPLSLLPYSSPPWPTDEDEDELFLDLETEPINDGTHASYRRQDRWRLQQVVNTLGRIKWSFSKLLEVWVTEEDDSNNPKLVLSSDDFPSKIYATSEMRRSSFIDAIETPTIQSILVQIPTIQTMRIELNHLTQTPYFGKFNIDNYTPSSIFDIEPGIDAIREVAPRWYTWATLLLQNQRSHRTSYDNSTSDLLPQRLFMITSMICHSRAPQSSNYFCSVLDCYLLGSGVKRRCIQTLCGLGVCHSYSTCNKLLAKVANNAKKQLYEIARNPQAVIVYDNFNFKDTVRDERLGHTSKMQNLTTAAIVLCPSLPTTGLLQSMHNPTIELKYCDILGSPSISGDHISIDITRSLIYDAINRIHSKGIGTIFSKQPELQPRMPSIDPIAIDKTKFWQLGGIAENEGTIAGTYKVHDNIFLDQLGLHRDASPTEPSAFTERLWLVHGDQLTAQHIRAVKNEQISAELPYDRRDWLLGLPALFHVQMNLLSTIIRTHWTPTVGKHSAHCLESDMVTLGRKIRARDNLEYHRIEPMLAQSFTARVVALFYSVLEEHSHFKDIQRASLEKPTFIDGIIAKLTPTQFNTLVDEIRLKAFTLKAWEGDLDDNFTTMCRMLQEIELFLTLRHAIKHGDIGMIRRLVDPLSVFFFGAGQHKYGYEMLFYRWNLSPVNTPELQHAILASGLVNWHGRKTTHKPIDLGIEHLNGSCAIEMKCYKNSTHDVDIIFNRVCLTNTFIRALRLDIEGTFGENMSGSHSTQSGKEDIFTLARNLFEGSFVQQSTPNTERTSSTYLSEDIITRGMNALENNITIFNQRYVRHKGILTSIIHLDDDEDVHQDNFVVTSNEMVDTIIDPTISIDFSQQEDIIICE